MATASAMAWLNSSSGGGTSASAARKSAPVRRWAGPISATGWLPRRPESLGQSPEDVGQRDVGEGAHLVVGAVLNGVGDEHGHDASGFEVGDVVHTARRARASIGERLDHHVAGRGDLMAQVERRRLGERRLAKAFDAQAPFA